MTATAHKNRTKALSISSTKELMTASERQHVRAFSRAIRKFTQKATSSQSSAMQILINAGLYTAKGKPKKQFR